MGRRRPSDPILPGLVLAGLVLAGLAGCSAAGAAAPTEQVAVLIATAEVHGTPEPCGCTSDPLGDVSRVVTLATGGLLLDAGNLLYNPEENAPERRSETEAKAKLLARVYSRGEVGLGRADLLHGRNVAPPRQAANVPEVPHARPRVHRTGGVAVGVFGVSQVEGAQPAQAKARAAIAELKAAGAEVVVALLGMTRTEARTLLEAVPGIGFGVIGAEVDDGMAEPEPVGGGFLVAPADQARFVARIELHVKGGKLALAPFAGEAARKLKLERAARKLAALDVQLAAWKKDPSADPAFVAARERERADLAAEKQRLETARPEPPAESYFTYALEPVRHTIPRDPTVAAELKELARAIGRANLKAARGTPPPAVETGQPRYVGLPACEKCHRPAVEFWQKTVHAHAWKTLVDVEKQYHFACIGCHVTGFEKPGGANLATALRQGLVDVQCEVCHGPGGKHVAEAGLEEPKSLVRRPPERFCADNCHTREHSDTFQLVPYMRDIVGKGHGEKLRAQLGDGPTGHELRTKALAAAGRK